tara:strand:+ start:1204 stop:1899 length:696 start_codon:yes stop_codon:yes gene_type:complete
LPKEKAKYKEQRKQKRENMITKTTPKKELAVDRPVLIQAVNLRRATIHIKGTAPLIQHSWNEKSKEMLRMTAAERRKVPKTARNPEAEFLAATCWCEDGQYGIPAMAVKSAMIEVAHKDAGLPKTTVRKALRFKNAGIIPMQCSEPKMREDIVRIGNNQTDIRYRPEFENWGAEISFDYDADLLTIHDVINLTNRAGFSVGIGEWRPEKNGEHGTFEVDTDKPTKDEAVTN